MTIFAEWERYSIIRQNRRVASSHSCIKGGEIRDTRTLNLSRNIVAFQVFLRFKLVDVSRFSSCVINLSRNKHICFGLKKVVAQSRARVNFEQQSLALLLVFHETLNMSGNKFIVMSPSWIPTKQINQSACCIFSTRNKCFCCATI